MKMSIGGLMTGASLLALGIVAVPGAAQAQDATTTTPATGPAVALTSDQAADAEGQDIVVFGVRESIRSAQAIKRNADQIVDSVNAQDIGKLPDANTTEALQRITGVQIQRRYGEGGTDFDHRTQPAITVRGLTQVQNFLDGRATYSASGGRAFDLEGIPPELLAGIDVYKNAPANIIEGGIGGAVNLRTRKPFDAKGQVISMTMKGNYYDRVDKYGGSISGLYSNRWETGIGDVGFLVNAVFNKSQYRQDGFLAGPFAEIAPGSIAGAPANAKIPYGFEIYDDTGDRKRLGVAAALQWQPNETLLVTAQFQGTKYWFNRTGAYYYDFNNRSNVTDATGAITSYGTDPLPGAAFTFNKEGYATSGALRNQVFETGRFDQELWSASKNYVFNVEWKPVDRVKATFDVQYLDSYYNADRNGHVLSLYTQAGQNALTVPESQRSIVDFDLSGKYPTWDVRNQALLANPNSYTLPFIADSLQRNDADQLALAYDMEYDNEGSFLSKLRAGVRYSDSTVALRGTWNGVGLNTLGAGVDAPAGTPLIPLSQFPQLAMPGPSKDFFDGNTLTGGILYPAFPAGGGVRAQTEALFALFGTSVRNTYNPGELNFQSEKTYTGYGLADYDFDLAGLRLDGAVGVRVVKTEGSSRGTQFNPDGTSAPITVDNSYTRALPSFNLRARFTDTLQARVAFSKSLARPNFDQLSTNLSLNSPNQINPITGRPSASSGNPRLKPIESTNYDVTLEWYFAPAGSLTGGLFYKDAKGFLANGVVVQTLNGIAYDVNTVRNTGDGKIKGAEIGFQQFFDFLPGIFSGFGIQANYTYVDSKVSNPFFRAGSAAPESSPLEKLSKHSYNLIGLYEKGPITARVAWNWRSRYLDATTGSGAPGELQFANPYASLDVSLSANLNDHIAVSADVVNLNNRMNKTYIASPAAPLQYQLNDRRFGLSVRATY